MPTLKSLHDAPEATPGVPVTSAGKVQTIEEVRLLTMDKKLLILGGSATQKLVNELEVSLGFSEIAWPNCPRAAQAQRFIELIGGYDFLLLQVMFLTHVKSPLFRDEAKRLNIPVIFNQGQGIKSTIEAFHRCLCFGGAPDLKATAPELVILHKTSKGDRPSAQERAKRNALREEAQRKRDAANRPPAFNSGHNSRTAVEAEAMGQELSPTEPIPPSPPEGDVSFPMRQIQEIRDMLCQGLMRLRSTRDDCLLEVLEAEERLKKARAMCEGLDAQVAGFERKIEAIDATLEAFGEGGGEV